MQFNKYTYIQKLTFKVFDQLTITVHFLASNLQKKRPIINFGNHMRIESEARPSYELPSVPSRRTCELARERTTV